MCRPPPPHPKLPLEYDGGLAPTGFALSEFRGFAITRHFGVRLVDLSLDLGVLGLFSGEETARHGELFDYTLRREQVGVTALIPALGKMGHLKDAFFNQRLDAVVDNPKADAQLPSQFALRDLRPRLKQTKNAVMRIFDLMRISIIHGFSYG